MKAYALISAGRNTAPEELFSCFRTNETLQVPSLGRSREWCVACQTSGCASLQPQCLPLTRMHPTLALQAAKTIFVAFWPQSVSLEQSLCSPSL